MADQCIVCLENLDVAVPSPQLHSAAPAAAATASASASEQQLVKQETTTPTTPPTEPVAATPPPLPPTVTVKQEDEDHHHNHIHLDHENHDHIAVIQVCGHVLHDTCLKEWTAKANSCPICRQSFHLVQVYDKVGGTLLSTYKVEEKKQVAEFDPQAWLDENPEEEEESTPCPVCNLADHEDVLLLCDGCDTPYHTYCIGLDSVPRGSWFCMECQDLLGDEIEDSRPSFPGSSGRIGFFPRTQASMRRARNRARSDEWQGAWGQVAGAIWDAINLDLDSHDGDDALEEYRRSQQLRERERREYQRWQQRLNIASRLGVRDVFARNIQDVVGQQVEPQPAPQPTRETREERQAWGALERARELDVASPSSRKRKSRSITASPIEPAPEPERRLKRPRTRRIAVQSEAGPSKSPSASSNNPERQAPGPSALSPPANAEAPSFLSSLLKEVEMNTPSDDENVRNFFGPNHQTVDPSSPVTSTSASAYNSPRALSITPPPNNRSASPVLSLSSFIEPVYPPANYSPTRSNGETSDPEGRAHHNGFGSPEIRQPRPRRQQSVRLPRSQDASPTRAPLPLEMKESISNVVRSALKPHWKSSQLTAEQYATINRDVSHKLYEEVTDPTTVDDDAKRTWEKIALKEVARAVAELKA